MTLPAPKLAKHVAHPERAFEVAVAVETFTEAEKEFGAGSAGVKFAMVTVCMPAAINCRASVATPF
jgi:hypothetical protein